MPGLPSVKKLEEKSEELISQRDKSQAHEFSLIIQNFIALLKKKKESLVSEIYIQRVNKLLDYWGNFNTNKISKKDYIIDEHENEISLLTHINYVFVNFLQEMASLPNSLFSNFHSSKLDRRIIKPTTSNDPKTQRMLDEMRR